MIQARPNDGQACVVGGGLRYQEVTRWRDAPDRGQYHRHHVEAAEALLSVDLTRYIPPMPTTDGICLYHPFPVEVRDPDGTFTFNYCEYYHGATA